MGRCKMSVEILADHLKNRILSGAIPPGTILPSIRKLGKQFELSYGTVYRTLIDLSKENWIEWRAGNGFFAKPPPAVDQYGIRVAVIMEVDAIHLNPGFLAYHILLGLRNIAAKNRIVLRIHCVHSNTLTQNLLDELTVGVAGVIMIGTYDTELNTLSPRCPAVGVLMLKSFGGTVSTVNLDLFDAIAQARAFFSRFVVRKTYIITSASYFYVTMAQIFMMFHKNIGSKTDLIVGSPEDISLFQPNTGYFFTSDQVLQQTSELFLEKTGVPLAARHIVLGVDGKGLLNPTYHRFPTLAVDWVEAGQLALRELLRRLENPLSPAINHALACRLIEPTPKEIATVP